MDCREVGLPNQLYNMQIISNNVDQQQITSNNEEQISLYFTEYPQVLKESILKILSLPSVIELLEKIFRSGKICVTTNSKISRGAAGWHCGERAILFNPLDISQDTLSPFKKIHALLFELNNADKSQIFQLLQSSAGKRELKLNDYVEKVEKMEFLTRKTVQSMLAECTKKGFIEDTHPGLIPIESFEVYYVLQQALGHSQQAEAWIKEVHPNIIEEY